MMKGNNNATDCGRKRSSCSQSRALVSCSVISLVLLRINVINASPTPLAFQCQHQRQQLFSRRSPSLYPTTIVGDVTKGRKRPMDSTFLQQKKATTEISGRESGLNSKNELKAGKEVTQRLTRGVLSLLLTAHVILFQFLGSYPAVAVQELPPSPQSSSYEKLEATITPSSSSPSRLASGQRYWTIMNEGSPDTKTAANQALMDYAVGTINTMYYDHTGGALFQPREFFALWRNWLNHGVVGDATHSASWSVNSNSDSVPPGGFTGGKYFPEVPGREQLATRQGVVDGLTWLTQQLHDPFSRYLTREELLQELSTNNNNNDGFLGLGAMVEPASEQMFFGSLRTPVLSEIPPSIKSPSSPMTTSWQTSLSSASSRLPLLSANSVSSLPILTAVSPNSPAERAGLTVGDRIVAVQRDSFLGLTKGQVKDRLETRYHAENYLGSVELTIAKPVYATAISTAATTSTNAATHEEQQQDNRSIIVAYRPQRIRLSTAMSSSSPSATSKSIVQYQMLTAESSPFGMMMSMADGSGGATRSSSPTYKVGYIRLTRFSKASTAAFIQAVHDLEKQGATAYILDLRNNYGGVIQEAMLTASSLLRDPHAVLCYTLNSRGGFTPHAVEEYVVDHRYPGYLLSREPKYVTMQEVKKESPEYFQRNKDGWAPPSSFASLHEQNIKRGIQTRPWTLKATPTFVGSNHNLDIAQLKARMQEQYRRSAQKPLVLLVNEGTASAAEVFASSLHDNGRTVAVVGTRTFGKGLIQHTFPLPDGGGLRLTVAEYLTPALQHMTQVGGAQFDRQTGEWVGGIRPDVVCESAQGIPANTGGDLCVAVGLDALAEARQEQQQQLSFRLATNVGNGEDSTRWVGTRRPVRVGIMPDDF